MPTFEEEREEETEKKRNEDFNREIGRKPRNVGVMKPRDRSVSGRRESPAIWIMFTGLSKM